VLLNRYTDSVDSSACTLTYDEHEHWLRATWRGYVDPLEAQAGAAAYLHYAPPVPTALLLDDNSQIQGPWFDSLDWLGDVWVPQAGRLGLRYVAHVLPAGRHADILSTRFPHLLPFELQIFRDVDAAQQWLRQCRDQPALREIA